MWDIKFNFYQLRFVILLPLITLLIDQANYEIKKLLKIILIPTLILFHLLIIGYLNNYNFDNRDIFGILFLYLIFLLTLINYKNFKRSLSIVVDIFTILFSITFIIFFFYSESVFSPDCYDGWFYRTKFIFMENSHFALISVPIINYYTILFCKWNTKIIL